jgi:hypothetical protein
MVNNNLWRQNTHIPMGIAPPDCGNSRINRSFPLFIYQKSTCARPEAALVFLFVDLWCFRYAEDLRLSVPVHEK